MSSGGHHPLRWLPPFILGVCAATAAEVAASLLLYDGPGLLRSLTAILGVEALSLALGLMTAPGLRPDLVDSLRRRWLFCLLAFVSATAFSAIWSMVQALGGSSLGQGLGLAFLAGLPLYSLGGVLGGMATVAVTEPMGRPGALGGIALLGGAVGFAATGVFLPQVLAPASLLLVCLVLLSAAGLVFGSVLDTRLRVHVRARRPSPLGDVQVEDRHLLSRKLAARVLLEGDFVRNWVILTDNRSRSWEGAVCEAFRGQGSPRSPILFIGGGASQEPRFRVGEDPSTNVDVVERSGAVVELGREHLDTGLQGDGGERLAVSVGNLDDALARSGRGYSLILLDTASFAPVGGVASLGVATRSQIFRSLEPGGVMALGPWRPDAAAWAFPEGWSSARYRIDLPDELASLGIGTPMEGHIWVGSRLAECMWPDGIGPFARVPDEIP
ncbi:MAG TPA: hypothetical protein VLA36_13290 [Longimicrobiales bacterium]|nr:hypothetical protein [Longimicrobiales bacterium]